MTRSFTLAIVAFDLVIRNGTVVVSGGRRLADVAVRDGTIAAVEVPGGIASGATTEIDAAGLHVLPGVIDGHVHFRSPGLEHEEDWLTGSRAAAFGGVTTVLDMPNTVPPTDTVERARDKLALAAASSVVDFGILGLLFDRRDDALALAGSGLVVGLKAFLGPTTGHLGPPADDALRDALATGRRVAVHAEDEWEIESNIQALPERGRTSPRAHLLTRTPETEVMAIAHLGKLVLEAGGAAHVVHVTSTAGLEAVLRWRDRGVDLTCELTPHHALLDHDVYDRFGGIAKVNPPIRGEPHASALLAALADGSIDTIASDHAPHLESDKRRASIWDVAAGIPGVETMLPLMLTEVADRRLSLERLVHATSEMPARIWGLWPGKGAIAVGSDADLTLIDLDRPGEVRAAEMHGKNNVTPFEGRSTRGAVVATIVRGRTVMRDGRLVAQPGWGRPVSRS